MTRDCPSCMCNPCQIAFVTPLRVLIGLGAEIEHIVALQYHLFTIFISGLMFASVYCSWVCISDTQLRDLDANLIYES
jgi:hypothetical protein